MTHAIYSRNRLEKMSRPQLWPICKQLGVPCYTSNQKCVEAIFSRMPQQIEATIDHDDSINGTVEGEYVVKVGGEVIHRTRTYMKAERFILCQGYKLVSPQEVAQAEFEAEVLKSQTEEKEDRPERPRIQVQEIDFGYYEAMSQGQVIATIERDFDLAAWVVNGLSFDSYVDAEKYVVENQEIFMDGRGSGRVTEVIETMNLIIEDTNIITEKGQAYAVLTNQKHGRVLAGNIFLDDDKGWTFDGMNFSDDWQPIANQMMKATKHEYLLAA